MRLFPLRPKGLFIKSTFESRLQLARLRQLAGFRRNSFSSAVLRAGPACAHIVADSRHTPPHHSASEKLQWL